MKLDKIKDTYDGRAEYHEKCSNCQRSQLVRTQADNDPEYYTTVYVECTCGDWIPFMLPVN